MLPWYLPLEVILTYQYKNGYLLKGKYPQLHVLQPPFPEGVTLDRLRGLHVSMTKAALVWTPNKLVLKPKMFF